MNEHVTIALPETNAYRQDVVAWSASQAQLLRERRFDEIDLENIVAEIESLGNSVRGQLSSRMSGLIEHLIKLQVSRLHDPRRQWILSVKEQRRRIEQLIRKNPSLKPELQATFLEEWSSGAEMARAGLADHDLDMIPDDPSFALADALDQNFIPEQ